MRLSTRIILSVLLGIVTLSSIFAAPVAAANPQRLNITFAETVFQNVTFAKDFYLTQNRTFSLIQGVLTVENPSADPVYDIYLRINNTDYLATNFTQVSGRQGTQIYYPLTNDSLSDLSSSITATPSVFGDVDADGTNDTVWVSNTAIFFNISGEYQTLSYTLNNMTGPANLAAAVQVFNTSINVTGVRYDGNYMDGRVYAVLTINGTETTASQLTVGEVSLRLNNTAQPFAIVHIPELRSSQNSVFNYTVSSTLVDPPLQINTTYTNPQFETKVLAGQYFAVNDSASNIATVGPLQIINISIFALGVNTSNGSSWTVFNFTIWNLSDTGDYQYVYGNGTSNRLWTWITNNGTIPVGQTYNISYLVRAPDTVPTSGSYAAIQENLSYMINATASRVGVTDVRSRADINITTSKEIVSPQDNLSNKNVTWQSTPQVSTWLNITFTLEKVTLWITSTRDPNAVVNNLNYTYAPSIVVDDTSTWIGSQWLFNFTDGSDETTAPPPIVWVKPYWIIQNSNGQILNQSITVNGTDTYIKYIYVINGYWLEVTKNVTNSGNGTYDIKTWVKNRGNGHTPQNLTVTVYDFVPSQFTASAFSPGSNNESNVSGQFTGTAYQWDVGLRTPLATSFAPAGDPSGLDQFWINYTVNGTGDYKVSDLYIVGLDPRKVDGANTFDGGTVVSSIGSTSKELIYLGIVVFLIAINVGNFLMTSRINKKLDKKE